MIYPPDAADRFATAMTLQLGNLSELNGPNPVPKHLMDYWNNYEGVRVGREIAAREGSEITNDRLAEILAGEINASIRAPLGKSRFILFNGYDQHAIDFKDPRLEVDRYDVNRLPNEAWGIGPLPKPEGYIPPAIIEAFPNLYQNPAPTPSSPPQRGCWSHKTFRIPLSDRLTPPGTATVGHFLILGAMHNVLLPRAEGYRFPYRGTANNRMSDHSRYAQSNPLCRITSSTPAICCVPTATRSRRAPCTSRMSSGPRARSI
jgi:hypothetical protein